MTRIAIIHPWLPQYRISFFDDLRSRLSESGVALDVYHGDPPPEWGERGDAVSSRIATHLPTRFVRIKGKSLVSKSVDAVYDRGPYDLLILEQAVRNLETYRLLAKSPADRIAYWGHGKTYTIDVPGLQERLKTALTNHGDWFFGYTSAGVDVVVRRGFDRSRTTIVRNSTDTKELVAGLSAITLTEIADFARAHDLRGITALYIGGLDSAKRIPFLLDAARAAHELDARFRLVIAGNGTDRPLVEAAIGEMYYVKYVGSLFGRDKYLAMASAQLLAMPGRVGLVAVDSLASGLPIVTTDWPFHAPEFEYLEPGVDAVVAPDDSVAFASSMLDVARDSETLHRMTTACRAKAAGFSIEAMSENFTEGVLDCLQRSPRSAKPRRGGKGVSS